MIRTWRQMGAAAPTRDLHLEAEDAGPVLEQFVSSKMQALFGDDFFSAEHQGAPAAGGPRNGNAHPARRPPAFRPHDNRFELQTLLRHASDRAAPPTRGSRAPHVFAAKRAEQ